ncbi:hypothetical protein COHA_004428 [Chlorella ohadii]|uniref:Large ribosomal subunit protein mL40 n=1 Tax=Chlorella ohadii TaxID=2649997 RepID=A0AAD5DT28_9CHLO|nr:hypothetical protein COHA_004428 [Chlorella ohadii]
MLGQALRRSGAASRLLSQCIPSSSSAPVQQLAQQLQQQAGFAKKGGETVDSRLQKVLKMLEPREVEEIEISAEDYAEGVRRSKEYSRRKMQEHREWQTDLTTKLKLKLAAIAALPPHLAAAAQVPDDELFPLNRQMFNDTPPIEGFGQAPVAAQQGGRKLGTKHR